MWSALWRLEARALGAMGYELSISGALADSPTQYFSNTGELKPELKVGGCVDALVLPGAD